MRNNRYGGRDRNRGFTLMELLIVMVIIGILAALLMPAYKFVKNFAMRLKAKAEVGQLELAWKQYKDDYRQWPATDDNAVPIKAKPELGKPSLLAILQGQDTKWNAKKIQYFEFKNLATDGSPVSPWADPDDPPEADDYYYVAFDADYDGKIFIKDVTPDGGVMRTVIVYLTVPSSGEIVGSWQ